MTPGADPPIPPAHSGVFCFPRIMIMIMIIMIITVLWYSSMIMVLIIIIIEGLSL